MKPRVIFMGTPEFARTILEDLVGAGACDIVAVYAQPDKPVGRGNKMTSPPVAEYAKSRGLRLLQPPRIREADVLEEMRCFAPDFIVVAAYGKILPRAILDMPKIDCLNVHASLLPKYRGAAPINFALLNGETETGVAIMKMVEELDAGSVYLAKKTPITAEDDAVTLTGRLAKLGGEALLEAMPGILKGELKPREQEHGQTTYAPKLEKEMAPVDWTRPAAELFNRIRALVPWPVAETTLLGKRLKIHAARPLTESRRGRPGEILHLGKDGWTVATGEGNILITEVQLEGKKRMSAFDVANGLRLVSGCILG